MISEKLCTILLFYRYTWPSRYLWISICSRIRITKCIFSVFSGIVHILMQFYSTGYCSHNNFYRGRQKNYKLYKEKITLLQRSFHPMWRLCLLLYDSNIWEFILICWMQVLFIHHVFVFLKVSFILLLWVQFEDQYYNVCLI